MFRASLCPSSGACELQQQPLVYRRNVVVAVLLAVVGPVRPTTANSTATTTLRMYLVIYVFCVLKRNLHVCGKKQKNNFYKKNLAVGVTK
jgi:hypothetical protein